MKPFQCEFFDLCNKPVPAEDISCLPNLSQSKFEQLMELGITSIQDIPANFSLTKYQQHARAAALSGEPWFSRDLRKKLNELRYPLYFMDFETLAPAIPRFAGMHPYDQIPFQWSVHVRRGPESELEHYEFLAEDTNDPRLGFLESLLRVMGDAGHIIVYNKSFESGVLGKLAEYFPQYKPAIIQLQARLWDLLPVIRSHTYHMDYRGSFSVKDVLPALVMPQFRSRKGRGGHTSAFASPNPRTVGGVWSLRLLTARLSWNPGGTVNGGGQWWGLWPFDPGWI